MSDQNDPYRFGRRLSDCEKNCGAPGAVRVAEAATAESESRKERKRTRDGAKRDRLRRAAAVAGWRLEVKGKWNPFRQVAEAARDGKPL